MCLPPMVLMPIFVIVRLGSNTNILHMEKRHSCDFLTFDTLCGDEQLLCGSGSIIVYCIEFV